MTRDQIIHAVKVRLEELTPFEDGLVVLAAESDVQPVASYIDSLLNESGDEVQMLLPLHMLTPSAISATAAAGTDGVYRLELPGDYLRLHSIKAPAWEREVNTPIATTNPEYALQRNRFTRAGNAKPVVAITYDGDKPKLELYTVSSTTLEKKFYIKRVAAESLADKLIPYVVLMCAIKVYGALERPDLAKGLSAELADMIKIQQL